MSGWWQVDRVRFWGYLSIPGEGAPAVMKIQFLNFSVGLGVGRVPVWRNSTAGAGAEVSEWAD